MQRVSLFGYGKTTKALAKHFPACTYYDDNVNKPFKDDLGNSVKPPRDFNPTRSDLQIPSPGMNPNHPLIKNAHNLISEYDYFSKNMPFSIWISGTNGKTTTTQMMGTLLEDRDAIIGGNVGIPLGDLDPNKKIWILESSSYTLHYTNIASPNVYILLPISPDHLSWHGNFDEYIKAKLKPLLRMKEGELAIIPKEYESYLPSSAFIKSYESVTDLAQQFDIDMSKINFKGGFLLDALLALCVEKSLFDTISYNKINAFTLEKHRQERIEDNQGRIWINDSKGTNIDATQAALDAYSDKKIYLILGGDDKGVELTPLFESLQKVDVEIYAIGANEERLIKYAHKFNIKCNQSSTIERAVKEIDSKLDKKSIALLSPAAASFDQFKSYEERGDTFRSLVKM